MKTRSFLVSAFVAFVLAGCGQKEPVAAPAAAAPAPAAGPRVIEITAGDNMQYAMGDQHTGPGSPGLRIEAKAGEELKIVFTNAGTAPKEAMGHNIVVLKAGSDTGVFATAASAAKDTDYIPAALKDQVVGHTAILGPKKSEELLLKLSAGE